MSEYAYNNAINAIRKGMYAVCIPGTVTHESEELPTVLTRGYVLPNTLKWYARHPQDDVRALFALNLIEIARGEAKQRGMALEAL